MSLQLNTPKEKLKKENDVDYQKAKDHEKVRGKFRFYEVPGGRLEFVYFKYKGDPLDAYKMDDGGVYEVPRMVANHLNESGAYPVHAYSQDEYGKPIPIIGKTIRRYGFHSLEFEPLENPNAIPANSIHMMSLGR